MNTSESGWVTALDARQRALLREMGVRVWAPSARQTEKVALAPAPSPFPTPSPLATPQTTTTRPATERSAPRSVPAPAALPAEPRSARAGIAQMDWPALREAVAGCQACGLCQTRRHTVFGVGDLQADWMIVGEAPGEQEDRQGEPFVGAAGQLLDAMLRAVQRDRGAEGERGVFIANVLKCRPPANRNPAPEEVAMCEPFLARQVALVQPKIIVAMGRFAVQSLLGTSEPIGRLRGRVHRYQDVPVVVTYHPAYLLRTPADKGKAWADLCLAMDHMAR